MCSRRRARPGFGALIRPSQRICVVSNLQLLHSSRQEDKLETGAASHLNKRLQKLGFGDMYTSCDIPEPMRCTDGYVQVTMSLFCHSPHELSGPGNGQSKKLAKARACKNLLDALEDDTQHDERGSALGPNDDCEIAAWLGDKLVDSLVTQHMYAVYKVGKLRTTNARNAFWFVKRKLHACSIICCSSGFSRRAIRNSQGLHH